MRRSLRLLRIEQSIFFAVDFCGKIPPRIANVFSFKNPFSLGADEGAYTVKGRQPHVSEISKKLKQSKFFYKYFAFREGAFCEDFEDIFN